METQNNYQMDEWQQFAASIVADMEKRGLKDVLLVGFINGEIRNIVVSLDKTATVYSRYLNKLSDDLDNYFRAMGATATDFAK